MNIIENVWAYVEHRVRRRVPLPKNTEELWTALKEEWYGLDMSYINNLYNSLPNRIKCLHQANGGPTRY
ncbi:hypothetical protein K435DRAFT_705308 [Dendrothele bispora CBS 962.96]|uniref:Tc1-like transposase DDE domain-containing protein n=1 Tax=Dendrothele bispora (strain CBS 962.96) TaxID=1314807 RepID=A0A4S8KL79_DENBC|nr:hypothetical protein K435DRAFT_705298 [Dendrothele bispora CBS 962.96]THU76223.1 hypothetical protein K435DRAFT_705308 [Dendrothele bispora CBS 962.96]